MVSVPNKPLLESSAQRSASILGAGLQESIGGDAGGVNHPVGVVIGCDNRSVRPAGHENVATVLVDPEVLGDFELDLMTHDFRVWVVHSVSTFPDAPRLAFQIRRSLIDWSQGRWAVAANWTLVWITFGESWLDGEEPIPWPAHSALWNKLSEYGDHVRYNLGLGGVPRLTVPRDVQ